MKHFATFIFTLFLATQLSAQTGVSLSGLSIDPSAPIETSADSLKINRDARSSVFEGNVLIGQGDFRLAAQRVEVITNGNGISRIRATGGVTFTTSTDAIEAQSADYALADGSLTMSGQVLLSQGQSAIMGDRVRINLRNGSAVFDGNVRTILQTGTGQ